MRTQILFGLSLLFTVTHLWAQTDELYRVPRTEYGHPDLQGAWAIRSLTPLERPDSLPQLVVSEAAAEAYVQRYKAVAFGDFSDPDTFIQNVSNLDSVHGELRSSAITIPSHGRMPLSDFGLEVTAQLRQRDLNLFDHPEQRPLDERCLGSLGYPPFRPFNVNIPRKIVQTKNYVLIYTEDPSGARIIHLTNQRMANSVASFAGYSTATWEENTLVIETSNFRDDDPARLVAGRPVLIGAESRVIEKLSRISEQRILYQFEVADPNFYEEPWSGEFTFQQDINVSYEYSCHEGNYSMPAILRGGQMEQARIAAENSNGI